MQFFLVLHVSLLTACPAAGFDAIFDVQAVPHVPGTAKAWVLSKGAILSVDAAFTDWCVSDACTRTLYCSVLLNLFLLCGASAALISDGLRVLL